MAREAVRRVARNRLSLTMVTCAGLVDVDASDLPPAGRGTRSELLSERRVFTGGAQLHTAAGASAARATAARTT